MLEGTRNVPRKDGTVLIAIIGTDYELNPCLYNDELST